MPEPLVVDLAIDVHADLLRDANRSAVLGAHQRDHVVHIEVRERPVASGDGRNFTEPLEALARDGVEVVVLSFSEVAGYAMESELLRFVDLEDVPGAFTTPLDRVRLDDLPPEGAWLRPTRSLREVASGVH